MEVVAESEIYPNAPLEFVACEVQFPVSPVLGEDDVLPALHRALFAWLPLVEPEVQTTLVVAGGQQPSPIVSKQLRFLSRDRRLSVVVSQSRVSVETTDYPGWAQFRGTISRALNAVEGVSPMIPGLSRVGLRYIDEIRVPHLEPGEGRWSRYIDPRLSGAASVLLHGRPPTEVLGVLQFDLGEGYRTVVRYGARHGQMVGGAPLRRRAPDQPSGEYFLIDVDSFHETGETLPEFSAAASLSIADRLHQPVRALFESSITDDLRNEVLRRAPSRG